MVVTGGEAAGRNKTNKLTTSEYLHRVPVPRPPFELPRRARHEHRHHAVPLRRRQPARVVHNAVWYLRSKREHWDNWLNQDPILGRLRFLRHSDDIYNEDNSDRDNVSFARIRPRALLRGSSTSKNCISITVFCLLTEIQTNGVEFCRYTI